MARHAPACLLACAALLALPAAGGPAPDSTDPLVAVDLNRTAIVADIAAGFESQLTPEQAATLKARLAALRADRLLAASLASSLATVDAILAESQASGARVRAKALGDANADLGYTPLAPCRLVDTRGFGAPIQGGAFTPNQRRAYVPAGACGIPTTGVASVIVGFTTQNLTPSSGGYLALVGPGAPVATLVDVFNIGAEWSAANTVVATGTAGQFDAFVANANAHLVIDVVGYFRAPSGIPQGDITSVVAGTGLSGGATAGAATLSIATPYALPQSCAGSQVPKWSGSAWICGNDDNTPGGGDITGVVAGTGLAGGATSGSATLSIATTYALPQSCAGNQVPKWGGSAWTCGNDTAPNAFLQGGNAFGATAVLGTTDANAVEIRAGGAAAMRLSMSGTQTVNVLAGSPANTIHPAVQGGTIAGGGGHNGVSALPNTVQGFYGTVSGGLSNSSLDFSSIGGGQGNNATTHATVAGGQSNNASGIHAAIAGGQSNQASGTQAFVGGGSGNLAQGAQSAVGGGSTNSATASQAAVGGGGANAAQGPNATIAGGVANVVGASRGAIGGGEGNNVQPVAIAGAIAGGQFNTVSGGSGSVGGGSNNTAAGTFARVGGGIFNFAGGGSASIAGGEANNAGDHGAVGGGQGNNAVGGQSTVAGGIFNTASGFGAAVGGGQANQASGLAATVPGGSTNVASGANSFSAGSSANAGHDGAFVWADNSGNPLFSSAANQFSARAAGGFVLLSNSAHSAGVALAPGASAWSSVSDRARKKDLAPVDSLVVLSKLAAMPMYTWRYIAEASGALHMGPVAQDFRAAFGLGDGDKTIMTIDADGVALAAIQGLNRRIDEKEATISRQAARIADLERALERVKAKLGL